MSQKWTKKDIDTLTAILLCVPLLIFAIIKGIISLFSWIITTITNSKKQSLLNSAATILQEIDNMDGLEFEHFVAKLLKKNGYIFVKVTKGSGDFGVDITAYKKGNKLAFQCKNYSNKLGLSPIQEVYSGAPKYNAKKCVVVTNSYFTPAAQELAETLQVILWDRIELAKLIVKPNKKKNKNKHTHDEHVFNESNSQEEIFMATTLGPGTYIAGINIPAGIYNLKAISGDGRLIIRKKKNDEIYISFGIGEYSTPTFNGLSLQEYNEFMVTGDVIFEITKATMIEIE